MNAYCTFVVVLSLAVIPMTGCGDKTTQYPVEKYPRKQTVSDERKSGPAMLLYEAAEADADPANVIVIPPDASKKNSP